MISKSIQSIPSPNKILGFAGLIPFWGLAFIVVFTDDPTSLSALKAQIAYGAIILSFLGGIHWGIAVKSVEKATWPRMSWGVILSLIGWSAIFIPPLFSITVLGLGLTLAIFVDLYLVDNFTKILWFEALRLVLSIGAIAALLFIFLYLIFS